MASNKQFLILTALFAACGSNINATADAPLVPDAAPSAPDAAPLADGAPAGDGGVGATCGGLVGQSCTAATYCTWKNYSCGVADQIGTCAARPGACVEVVQPVCACNGMTYSNECAAATAGQDLSDAENCPPPEGMFSCGTTFCSHGSEYCRKTFGPTPDASPTFRCEPIPGGCGQSPSCGCLAGEMCGSTCTQPTTGNFVLTCLLP
jgi:hypothetical protein